MNYFLDKINELYITCDLEYGYNVTYRIIYPDYTKSFFSDCSNFSKLLKILNEDIESEIRIRSM